jgi:hypothetical protein
VRDRLLFIALVFGWAELGRASLSLDFINPFALGAVWLIGLAWMVGTAMGYLPGEKHLLKGMIILVAGPLLALWDATLLGYAT